MNPIMPPIVMMIFMRRVSPRNIDRVAMTMIGINTRLSGSMLFTY